jgi:large subunit ribosomal protein L22|uniref:Large ribosomal subunit protein uL22c n=2 Tax=Cyanidioschyzon merolae TaxID=45157 RepID=RK22_CYAM1|nr:ribosomal protein L22 [Cyanidioschyzon merolae strain 10D]Q85FV8.1 RecName: Full=Large ribosomal subunit protein uL22c; AltName: Full=50S ribosomal protein L22, chloroplastic [Cyanidioschyzon merolae strain 10D]QFV17025.1 50S ribosomal protein L22 [Cyanidioschyzon merolae]BAC76236.1 50S ribosomal protein L22 [Cyanidioschyzon merolae strain 10D]
MKYQAKYIRMSPTKVRRVVRLLDGMTYEKASQVVRFLPYRAATCVAKLLKSVNAQATQRVHFYVDQAPTLKRIRARAQSRAYPIKKRCCHITLEI